MKDILRSIAVEHHGILALLLAVLDHTEGEDWEGATNTYDLFAMRLGNHIRMEDELVFPLVRNAVGDLQFPLIRKLTSEHEVIWGLAKAIEAHIHRRNKGGVKYDVRELEETLKLHETVEEQSLYPILDRALSYSTVIELAKMLADVSSR